MATSVSPTHRSGLAGAHPVDRARLTERAQLAPPVHRYAAPARLGAVVRHYWVPVWDLPAGTTVTEQILPYPTCLVVVARDYARFYGVTRGRSSRTLAGSGWAVGVMLQPGAGPAVAGRSTVRDLVDTHLPLGALPGLAPLTIRIRDIMADAPGEVATHRAALAELGTVLGGVAPLEPEGALLNRVVDAAESDPALLTVSALADRTGVSERSLQRLTDRFLGLTPKWLIQRRRLHDATEHLKHGTLSLAELAADLGYTDQAHLTRDFRRVTGYTPAQFARTLGRDSDGEQPDRRGH